MGHQGAMKYLLLASLLGLSSTDRSLLMPKTSLKQFPIAPEPRRMLSGTALMSVSGKRSLSLTLVPMSVDSLGLKCSLTLDAKNNSKALHINAVKLLDGDRFVLVTYEEFENGDPKVTFSMFSIEDCGFLKKRAIITRIGGIKKLIVDKTFSGSTRELVEFGSDWPKNDIRVEVIADDLLLVQFHDKVTGDYKVRLYNSSLNYTELLSIRNAAEIEVLSANLTICWVRQPGEYNLVNCSRFDKHGNLEFNEAIVYLEGVHLSLIKNNLDEVLLISRGFTFRTGQQKDLGYMYFSTLSKNREPSVIQCLNPLLYKCFENTTNVAAFEASIKNGSNVSFTVICESDSNYEIIEGSCNPSYKYELVQHLR